MIRINADVAALRDKMRKRMKELEPAIKEYEELSAQDDIITYAKVRISELQAKLDKARPRAATPTDIIGWAKNLEPDQIVRSVDLSDEFGRSPQWGRYHMKQLVEEGVMEEWGKARFRRVPDKTGTARLKVVTR